MSQRSDYGRCMEAYTILTCQSIQMLGICQFVLQRLNAAQPCMSLRKHFSLHGDQVGFQK